MGIRKCVIQVNEANLVDVQAFFHAVKIGIDLAVTINVIGLRIASSSSAVTCSLFYPKCKCNFGGSSQKPVAAADYLLFEFQ